MYATLIQHNHHHHHHHHHHSYLVRVTLHSKADKPVTLIFELIWNLDRWFLLREENQRTRRKTFGSRTRTNNKLNLHVTPGPGIEPRPQRWEVSALTTALPPLRHPCIPWLSYLKYRQDIMTICQHHSIVYHWNNNNNNNKKNDLSTNPS